jgi:hypothetical protein
MKNNISYLVKDTISGYIVLKGFVRGNNNFVVASNKHTISFSNLTKVEKLYSNFQFALMQREMLNSEILSQ